MFLLMFLVGCGSNAQYYGNQESIPNGYGVEFCSACPINVFPNTVPRYAYCFNNNLLGLFGNAYDSMVLGTYTIVAPECACKFIVNSNCTIQVLENQ